MTQAADETKVSREARKTLRVLARLCTELLRPVSREEWEEALGGDLSAQRAKYSAREIGELLERELAEEWRDAYRVSAKGMALLKRGGLEKIDARDGWALGDDHRNGPLYGEDVRRVARLDDLLPLGYGDKLVPVSDERFALVDAQPGDVLVFRQAQQVQPGDIYLDYRQQATPQGLARVTEDTKGLWGELVLVAHIRRMR